MKKQVAMLVLKYGLGLGLLAWVIYGYWYPAEGQEVGLVDVFSRPIRWHYLALASMLAVGSVLLTFVRWFVLVRAQGLPFRLPDALRLGMIGFYLSTFLPGSVGGDIVKAAFIAREQDRRTVAVATVIIDRVVGLYGLLCLVTITGAIFLAADWLPAVAATSQAVGILEAIILTSAGLLLGSLAFWVILGFLPLERAERFAGWLGRVPKLGGAFSELWRAAWVFRSRGLSVGLALLLALIGHFGFVLVFFFSSRTLNLPGDIPTAQAHFLAVPVGATISAGIPTPGAVGGGEFVFGKLYEFLGFSFAAGVLGSLMQRSINWGLGLVGYLIYLRMKRTVPLAA